MSNQQERFELSTLLFEHPVVGIRNRPYSETEAWIWLVAKASPTPTKVMNKGQATILGAGQVMASYAQMSSTWGWSTDKIRWFLKRLQREGLIVRSSTDRANQIQMLAICEIAGIEAPLQQADLAVDERFAPIVLEGANV
jgi:hypothetical protein